MKAFQSRSSCDAVPRMNEHGGHGPIAFRRMLDQQDFNAPVDFVDFTVIPPGSTIGRHRHVGNDEIYYIVSGRPRVCVDDREMRLESGSLTVVHDGGCHELVNDTPEPVEILVIQVRA